MNAIENAISTTLELFVNPGVICMEKGGELRNESVNNDSWAEDFAPRGLFVAQTIISIVTIPFAILAMIVLPTAALCTKDGKEDAWEILKAMIWITGMHLSLIPTCFIATFARHSSQWASPLKETLTYLKCLRSDDD